MNEMRPRADARRNAAARGSGVSSGSSAGTKDPAQRGRTKDPARRGWTLRQMRRLGVCRVQPRVTRRVLFELDAQRLDERPGDSRFKRASLYLPGFVTNYQFPAMGVFDDRDLRIARGNRKNPNDA